MTALEAGRDLDALVAKRIFGAEMPMNTYPDRVYLPEFLRFYRAPGGAEAAGWPRGKPSTTATPPYSTDIAAAWLVVERSGSFMLYQATGGWVAQLGLRAKPYSGTSEAWAETAPLAICRAALASVGE